MLGYLRIFSSISLFLEPGTSNFFFQSLKQNASRSARLGNFCIKFSNFFVWRNIPKQHKSYLQVHMSNSKLPTNFQLNIFIFEARASLQTLPQSLKQNANMSARLGTTSNEPSFTCDLVLHDLVYNDWNLKCNITASNFPKCGGQ